MSITSDLAVMLKDAPGSVAVKYNGASTWGILDILSSEFADDAGRARTKVTQLRIATGSLEAQRISGRIVVADIPYRVDDAEPEGDGLETVLTLARLS